MRTYVAYYRVSTDKQGLLGLGMDAQKEAVSRFTTGGCAPESQKFPSGSKTRLNQSFFQS
jgi:DNA invertase Pin-like site-specific DNA recombinase